ncbi:2'-5' RNA ligase [Pseudoduganella namucuonensis]|uniref:RNA 2',3'-cyclic phosphodiesterase n=2 Tax=Pseudoduganella namucuonensis TaxID=1035707 RepID=A0A1I7KKZ1_9BURK|nr:2'-5' RNA ligase [Pseudoduganella namucuonensis]
MMYSFVEVRLSLPGFRAKRGIMITNHKLFFALWPDDSARAALARLRALAPGRHIAPEKLHLTLAFLGRQPSTALPGLLGILERLEAPELPLRIDCLGYFARPRIAWAGMTRPPAALAALQAALMAELEAAGFPPSIHDGFKPHVTLAREAGTAPAETAFEPVAWRAREVALVESFPSGEYAPIAVKALARGAARELGFPPARE